MELPRRAGVPLHQYSTECAFAEFQATLGQVPRAGISCRLLLYCRRESFSISRKAGRDALETFGHTPV